MFGVDHGLKSVVDTRIACGLINNFSGQLHLSNAKIGDDLKLRKTGHLIQMARLLFIQQILKAYEIAPSTICFFLSSSSKVETIASVVSNNPAMLAALANAVRTTLTGSITPALSMSTYSPVKAL